MRERFFSAMLLVAALSASMACTASRSAEARSAWKRLILSVMPRDHSVAFSDPQLAKIAAAVARGDTARIAALAPDTDLSAHGDQNVTLLEWAIWSAQPRALAALLDAGADPSEPGMDEETVVHMAAMAEDPRYLAILLRHGAPADPMSPRSGWTPLFRAVQSRREVQFRLLLQAGADLNRVDHMGNSLLHLANIPFVLTLLEAGVDPTLRNAQGATFQEHFFDTPERLLNATGKQTRAAVRAWLTSHGIPLEEGR